jgi:hypothetical protein
MAPKGKSREEKKALILNAMHEAVGFVFFVQK